MRRGSPPRAGREPPRRQSQRRRAVGPHRSATHVERAPLGGLPAALSGCRPGTARGLQPVRSALPHRGRGAHRGWNRAVPGGGRDARGRGQGQRDGGREPPPHGARGHGGAVQQLNEAAMVVLRAQRPSRCAGTSPRGPGPLAQRRDGAPDPRRPPRGATVARPRASSPRSRATPHLRLYVTGLRGLGSENLLVALYDRTDELRAQRELIAREKLATVGEIASGRRA